MSLDIPTLVIATTYRNFERWCHREGIHPRSKGVVWVRGVRDLMGRRNVRIAWTPGAPASEELKDYLRMMEKTGAIAPPPTLPSTTGGRRAAGA